MIAHEAVPWIVITGNVAHAVQRSKGGWDTTACGQWTPSGTRVDEPKRKCRACVKVLKRAFLLPVTP
jgi:hypothetical protein